MARRPKDEIEVVFGFKQVLGVALLTALVLGVAFLCGLEVGHKRAIRGEPSLLAFLEESADPMAEPVAIPDVLLTDPAATPGLAAEPHTPEPAQSSGTPPPPESAGVDLERVKPNPAVQTSAAPTDGAQNAESATPEPGLAVAAAAPVDSRQELHYQVAALRGRNNAKQLVDWLRSEGLPGKILPAGSDGLYRVCVGPFRNAEDAASAKAQLARDGFKPMVRML